MNDHTPATPIETTPSKSRLLPAGAKAAVTKEQATFTLGKGRFDKALA